MDWKRIEQLFAEALERPAAERASFLLDAVPEDAELRAEVERLLESERRSSGFLEEPALASPRLENDAAALIGLEVPHYQVLRKLGEGGMGAVFLARRDDEVYEREVAIKFLSLGLWSEALVSRFRAERQILADLDHPYIARLLDGGTTVSGVPYFVMEYVEGAPIDQYCDRHRLSVAARIELFLKVCSAVHYAHANLVVHRDIKPTNILVRDDGEPRLLDFGIAKLLDDRARSSTDPTVGLPMMTPAFASPEQIARRPITTASDVYSLGVLLYFLLSGRHPFQLEGSSLHDIVSAILTEEPPLPSVASGRRASSGSTPAAIASLRHTSPAQLRRQLGGDLDTIVLKALHKEPARRYLSAEQFAEDLRRYRDGFPVLARRDTFDYRVQKFAARHPLGVAAASAFLAIVLGFSILTSVQSVRLRRALRQAEHETSKARSVIEFLEQTLGSAHPFGGMGRDVTLLEVLEHTATEIEAGGLTEDPEVEAAARRTVGMTYLNLGHYDAAAPLLERALELRRRVLGERHPDVAESLVDLAALLTARGQLDAAALHAQSAIELLGEREDKEALRGKARYSLGRIRRQQERFDEAEALLEEALALRRSALPPKDPTIAAVLRQLANVKNERGDFAGAEALYLEALELLRTSPMPSARPQLSLVLNDLALLRRSQGRLVEAQELLEQALARRRELLGEQHTAVAEALNNLASVLADRGDYEGAEAAIRRALEIYQKIQGEEDRSVAGSLANLGAIRLRRGDVATAEQLFRRALDLDRRLLGEGHTWVASDLENLGSVRRIKGDLAGAEAYLREAHEIKRQQLGAAHPSSVHTLHILAGVLQDRGDSAGALAAYRDALELYAQSLDARHWSVAVCRSDLGALLTDLGRYDEAEALLRGALASLQAALGQGHEQTVLAAERLEQLLAARTGRGEKSPERPPAPTTESAPKEPSSLLGA